MLQHVPLVENFCSTALAPMSLTSHELADRFRASILGFAIGDALGFPFRGLGPKAMGNLRFLGEDFSARGGFQKGQFSDDTQMMMAAADAVTRLGRIEGRSIAQHLAWLWEEGTILQPTRAATQASEGILAGRPWMSTGAEVGQRDASCLSRGVVAGLFSESSPPRLAHNAHILTVMTHKDLRCTAAVSAVARAIQLGLTGQRPTAQEFCEEISMAVAVTDVGLADEIFYLPRVLSWDTGKALAALSRVGVSQVEAKRMECTPESGLPSHVTPVLLTALFSFLRFGANFREALVCVLQAGGEIDVAAGVCGAIWGAHFGTSMMPARLRKNVMYGEALFDVADKLFLSRMNPMMEVPASSRSYRTPFLR
jgi:ADP-ribosyl-[dinitrogen reductase] hydrolase